MARFHRGVAIGAICVAAGGATIAWAAISGSGFVIGKVFGDEEKPIIVNNEPAFKVDYAQDPKPKVEEKQKDERQTLTEKVEARKEERATRQTKTTKQETLTEKWLKKVNENGMLAFGEDSGSKEGAYNPDGACSTLRPIRVRAMIADAGTTDQPGMALGQLSESVQGVGADGEPCVVLPEMSAVTFMVDKAGEYATSRAPVKVDRIWVLEDGYEVVVNQPAKHIDGVAGVVGSVNHHVTKKTLAGVASVLFTGFNNATSALSFRTTEVTNPAEEALRKTLNQPSEVTFDQGKVVEFDLMPISTPGYNQ